MGKGNYSAGKRLREAERARKKQEKQDRLRRNRENQRPGDGMPLASADEIQSAMPELSELDISPSGVAPRPDRKTNKRPARIFVGGLSWDTSDEELREAFSSFGEISDAVVIYDRQTGRSRGFGFVTYSRQEDAERAIEEMDGAELDSRRLKVTLANERA